MYLINVVKAVKPYLSKKDYDCILEKLNANNETQLLRFITHQWYDALHLSTYLNERLLIVKKHPKVLLTCTVLFMTPDHINLTLKLCQYGCYTKMH